MYDRLYDSVSAVSSSVFSTDRPSGGVRNQNRTFFAGLAGSGRPNMLYIPNRNAYAVSISVTCNHTSHYACTANMRRVVY